MSQSGTGKWFTCAPLRFQGGAAFFSRDSGLLCKGFQQLGIECQAILPGPPMDDDFTDDLIRTEYSNLEDPEWWKELGGVGVVFYGWGSGKYAKIARAIKEAGMLLISHMDTGGIISILNGPVVYAASSWRIVRGNQLGFFKSLWHAGRRLGYASTIGLITNDFRRASHLRQADLVAATTPVAVDRIKRVCRYYGGSKLAEKVVLLPHSVSSYMEYDPRVEKEELVIAIGRWNDELVKGTSLLIQTISSLLQKDSKVKFEIYGILSRSLEQWVENLSEPESARVQLKGKKPNSELRFSLERAMISICTSYRESFHIASAEALCCGATVVGPRSADLPGLSWFTEKEFGTNAEANFEALSDAILAELNQWRKGFRNPQEISNYWKKKLHASKVAERILDLVEKIKK